MSASDSLEYVPYDGEVLMDEVEFPHPFYQESRLQDGDIPRTLVELRMCALSAALRAKPEWWRKCTDPEIRARWTQEALSQDDDMTPEQVDYVLDELAGYSSLRDEKTGIEIACCDRIWQSDTLVSDALRDALKQGTKVLENVPDEQKDWHPRSNGFVLDLVHPSLYPLVYGRSMVNWNFKTRGEALRYAFENDHTTVWGWLRDRDPHYRTREGRGDLPSDPKIEHLLHWLFETREEDVDNETWRAKAETAFEDIENEWYKSLAPALDPRLLRQGLKVAQAPEGSSVISERFAWLPTNFVVGASGVKMLGYINNIHPSNTTLLDAVESIVAAFVPLFERVLTDLLPENAIPLRVSDKYERSKSGEPEQLSDEGDTDFEDRYNDWHAEQPLMLDLPAYPGAIEKRAQKYSLRGRDIQVIVKLASIVLIPEKAEYPGGSWHVEGMKNERIVASGIYYYDEENIGESRLAFRTAVREPENYDRTDPDAAEEVWGLDQEAIHVQDLGSIETKSGRCIAFPNIFQHRVAPFSLVDKTKPGHRKILALFLVDPNVKIPSTSIVAPQQKDLLIETLQTCGGRVAKLPTELLQLIAKDTHIMTRAEAFAYREELMDERTRFVDHQAEEGQGFFGATFNMCEH
ncbi:hypothetical protein EXIGLDRAFT_730457 [Exidia glandulosa HHB12029]|uniref:Uncharacterized protein n=1 Tax=Exidia glandulosa HHB12029 TaxID=1314781 RepID=A0A165L8U9_EXIGL|nr:hypothetical protein EXIGLDRAFT_730457 [Exidia glandulosa HHB12029]